MELAKKNVLTLAIAQGLSITSTGINIIHTGLVGVMLAPKPEYATIPLSFQFITVALTLIPISLLMGKFGRKIIFFLGILSCFIGSLLVVFAIFEKSFLSFIFAAVFIGLSQSTQQFYRYAATDNVPNEFKSKAISLVLAGGIIAAILGPELSKLSYNYYTEYEYLSAYLVAAAIQIINIFVLCFLKIPPNKNILNEKRSVISILSQKKLILAVFTAALGYSLMSFLMTAAPLQIVNVCKLGNDASANVIQWHVIAMFAPSFFTGYLISKYGNRKIMLLGILFYLFSIYFGTIGEKVYHFWLSLFFCGLGWNFLYVGGSDVIAKSTNPKERASVQGITDFIIFFSVSIASLLAGTLHSNIGWNQMLYMSLIPLFALGIYVVNLFFTKEVAKTQS